jgi:hypothetical protein
MELIGKNGIRTIRVVDIPDISVGGDQVAFLLWEHKKEAKRKLKGRKPRENRRKGPWECEEQNKQQPICGLQGATTIDLLNA